MDSCNLSFAQRELNFVRLEKRERFPGLASGEVASEEDSLFIPGGGFTKALYNKL